MKKQFEEKKLRISVSIAYDPDDSFGSNEYFINELIFDVDQILQTYKLLYKNIDVELEDIEYE